MQPNHEPHSEKPTKSEFQGMFGGNTNTESNSEEQVEQNEGYQSGRGSTTEENKDPDRNYMRDTPLPSGSTDIFQQTGIYSLKERHKKT